MKMLEKSAGAGRRLKCSRFSMSRLRANKKAKALLPQIKPQHDALKAAQLAANEAEDAELDARGPVAEVDAQAHEVMTDMQFVVAKVVNKKFDHPLYKAVYPKGLSGIKKLGNSELRAECKRIRGVLAAQPKDSPLLPFVAQLDALDTEWVAPVAAHDKTVAAGALANTRLETAKHDWYLAYDALAGALRNLFPGRRAFVDSFFLDVSTAPKKAKAVALAA